MAAAARRGPQWGESRAFGRAVRLLQRLGEQCRDPRLGSSPPSLRDLLPRTAQLLREVAQARRAAGGGGPEAAEGPGGAGDFLMVFLANLEAKSRQVAALLPPRGRKTAADELFREGSRLRRQLAKLALVFSYMHAELSALFPQGKYCGHLYQLTKVAAHTFWREHCGARGVLPWAEFEALLCICHPVEPGSTALALRSTIDLTCSGHVSIFEFDIFTRLFQPWPTLLKNWQLLAVNHPGYMAFLTYDEVQARLQACRDKPGSYIFRPSCTRLGQWAIGYVSSDGSILQTIPLNKPLFQALLEGQKEGFYLYPDGKNHNPDLTELCGMGPYQRIHVSEEQLQLYWAMNSTYELCKICAERNKDVKIEPCGHLLCSLCLATWQNSDSQTCPFCRCQIKGQEPVSIHQFQERPEEASAEDPGDSSDQEDGEEELGQVTPSAPPRPPQLDMAPESPRSKYQLEVLLSSNNGPKKPTSPTPPAAFLPTSFSHSGVCSVFASSKRPSPATFMSDHPPNRTISVLLRTPNTGASGPPQTSGPFYLAKILDLSLSPMGNHLQPPGQGGSQREFLKGKRPPQLPLRGPPRPGCQGTKIGC